MKKSKKYLLDPHDIERVHALADRGLSIREIAEQTGLYQPGVSIAVCVHKSPVPTETPEREPNDPTHEEIRAACLEIQRGWSRRERARRAGLDPDLLGWLPPIVALAQTDHRTREEAA